MLIELSSFNDGMFAELRQTLTRIKIRAGWVVDAIQLEYDGKYVTMLHGGEAGTPYELVLGADEWIKRINYVTADYEFESHRVISEISIITNKGRVLSGGTGQSCWNRVLHSVGGHDDVELFAFRGEHGIYMSSLEAAISKHPLESFFSGLPLVQLATRLDSIIGYSSTTAVNGLKFIYNGSCQTPLIGSAVGTGKQFLLAEGDFIESLTYQEDSRRPILHWVCFVTNRGRRLEFGGRVAGRPEGSFPARAGFQILGFSGTVLNNRATGATKSLCHIQPAFRVPADGSPAPSTSDSGSRELLSPQTTTMTEAFQGTYYTAAAIRDMVDRKLPAFDESTQRVIISQAASLGDAPPTKKWVTRSQYVFRGLGVVGELAHMTEERALLSRAMGFAKRDANFWNTRFPRINGQTQHTTQVPESLIYRLAATKTSSNPPSQFVSVALSLDLAAKFTQDGTVYCFRLVPNSNLMGLPSSHVMDGEPQFQVLGGTSLLELYRFHDTIWEEYDYTSRTWKPAKVRPVNREFEALREQP